MPAPVLWHFEAGSVGTWRIIHCEAVVGDGLAPADRLAVAEGQRTTHSSGTVWTLTGFTSNERYVERHERNALSSAQEGLGRPDSTCAALIPIRKSDAWWDLTQDERRQLLEVRSHHIEIGLEYLPPIARRLHHSRDLGEPFDFLTWFEYRPSDQARFEELVGRLRATEEWEFVEREVDIRLTR